MPITDVLALFWQISTQPKKAGTAMKTTAVILALALTTGTALTTAFGCGFLPLLSNDACFIVKGQLPQLATLLPSQSRIAKLPEFVREE